MSVAARLLTVLLAAGAALAGTPPTAEEARALAEASALHGSGDVEAAAELLEGLVRENPGLTRARRLLGHAYADLGRDADARRELVAALEAGGLAGDVVGRLVQLDRRRGDGAAVLAGLRLLVLLDPEDRAAALLYGEALADHGDTAAAAAVLEGVLERDAADTGALLRLGNIRLAERRSGEATALLETAWRLGARPAGLAGTIGDLWLAQDLPAAAARWYETALSAAPAAPAPPDRAARSLTLARALEDAGEDARAAEIADTVARGEGPSAGPALALLARLARRRGAADDAAQLMARAIDRGLADPETLAAVGRDRFEVGRYAEAADLIARALAARPDGPSAPALRRALIRSLLGSGRRDEAAGAIEDAIARDGLDEPLRRVIEAWRSGQGTEERRTQGTTGTVRAGRVPG